MIQLLTDSSDCYTEIGGDDKVVDAQTTSSDEEAARVDSEVDDPKSLADQALPGMTSDLNGHDTLTLRINMWRTRGNLSGIP